jgi:putative membrane protein insertion efficiency factor
MAILGPVGILIGLMLRAVIRAYQLLLAPVLPPACRYLPSCSQYAEEAIARHGPLHGGFLAARRLCRCHPWGGSGYDPVPEPLGGGTQ